MELVTRLEPGQPVKLTDHDADASGDLKKKGSSAMLAALGEELESLQNLLYAAATHSVLVVLQGMDTSGKDGLVRRVFSHMNPQGCRIETFKAPIPDELAHDFLWRVHKVTPTRGHVTVFNRSHYEDVLIVRVHKLVPHALWSQRYDHINNFERLLHDNNTIVLKFFLHISKEEQEARLLAREQDPEKAWKLAISDWQERKLWDHYQSAYEDALRRCSTDVAPWYIVPANKKWFRDVAVAQALVEALRPFRNTWTQFLAAESKTRQRELKKFRRDNP